MKSLLIVLRAYVQITVQDARRVATNSNQSVAEVQFQANPEEFKRKFALSEERGDVTFNGNKHTSSTRRTSIPSEEFVDFT